MNKRRLFSNIIFVIIFIIGLLLIDLFSFTDLGDNILGRVFFATGYRQIGSAYIVPAIKKTEDCSDYTKLILGDSVANQVFSRFDNDNDDYLILTTNQGVTVTGQYILAKRFLDNSPNATDIYLILLPGGFSTDHTAELSYSYLIEPFGKMGCLNYLTEDTQKQIKDYYGSFWVNEKVVNYIDNSCINNKIFLFYNQNRKKNESEPILITEECRTYLIKLYEECNLRGVELHLLPSPVVDNDSNVALVDELKREEISMNLDIILGEYFSRISYYPEEMFGDDVHFGNAYSDRAHCEEYINRIIGDSDDLEGLIY